MELGESTERNAPRQSGRVEHSTDLQSPRHLRARTPGTEQPTKVCAIHHAIAIDVAGRGLTPITEKYAKISPGHTAVAIEVAHARSRGWMKVEHTR